MWAGDLDGDLDDLISELGVTAHDFERVRAVDSVRAALSVWYYSFTTTDVSVCISPAAVLAAGAFCHLRQAPHTT